MPEYKTVRDSRYKHRRTSYKYDRISPTEAIRLGYIPYSGPYKSLSEDWMVRRAVWDIVKNSRDKYAIISKGSQAEIHIIPNYYLFSHHNYNFNPNAIRYGDENAIASYRRINDVDDPAPPNGAQAKEETEEVLLDEEIEVENGQPEEGGVEAEVSSGEEKKNTSAA